MGMASTLSPPVTRKTMVAFFRIALASMTGEEITVGLQQIGVLRRRRLIEPATGSSGESRNGADWRMTLPGQALLDEEWIGFLSVTEWHAFEEADRANAADSVAARHRRRSETFAAFLEAEGRAHDSILEVR